MSRSKPSLGQFVLFRADPQGMDVPAVAAQVRAAKGIELLHQSDTALLVAGVNDAVKALTSRLAGWRSERNGKIRSVS